MLTIDLSDPYVFRNPHLDSDGLTGRQRCQFARAVNNLKWAIAYYGRIQAKEVLLYAAAKAATRFWPVPVLEQLAALWTDGTVRSPNRVGRFRVAAAIDRCALIRLESRKSDADDRLDAWERAARQYPAPWLGGLEKTSEVREALEELLEMAT